MRATIAGAALVSVAWYALVEWAYFSRQGPTFRRVFSRVNRVSVDDFSYRAPWLAAVSYVVLVVAFALLAVWPAVHASSQQQRPSRRATGHPGRAYLACLWRAVTLSAAVYIVYDFTTYTTVFPFGLHTALWDVLYGVVAIPVLVVAPAAALLAHLYYSQSQ